MAYTAYSLGKDQAEDVLDLQLRPFDPAWPAQVRIGSPIGSDITMDAQWQFVKTHTY